jgi:hypothetical protein
MGVVNRMFTPLWTGQHAGDKGSLRGKEEHEHRQDRRDDRQGEFGAGDVQTLACHGIERRRRGQQLVQADLDGELLATGQHQIGQEEVVPVADETEERDQSDDGPGQWQCDPREHLP